MLIYIYINVTLKISIYITIFYIAIIYLLLVFGICNLVLLMLVPIWSRVLGFILTEFQSRHLTEILNNEYFINEEKYFYLILIHFYVSICIGGITLVSTGSMLISYFKHVCGMFKIAR